MKIEFRIATLATMAIAFALPVAAQPLHSGPIVLAQTDGRQQALDQATTMSVKSALQLDSELKTESIVVDTINGTVRLTGQVSSASNYERATTIVSRVPGVKAVDNQLVVKPVKAI